MNYDLTPSALAEMFSRCRPSERAAWIAEASRLTGHSEGWFYARARSAGWTSGRKKRADAGKLRSGLSVDTVYAVAAAKLESRRDNGKKIAGTRTALSLITGQPYETLESAPSVGTVNRALRAQGLGRNRLGRVRIFERVNKTTGEVRQYISEPCGILHSDHPNQLHQVDTSVCVIYQFTKARQLKIAAENTLYKNKPANFIRMIEKRKLIIRYVLVDHCSGSIYWRYFEAAGENAADMGEFLFHAWRRKEWMPFHGAPDALRGDAGAGLENRLLKNLLSVDKLNVRLLPPLPGNKEANGAAENAHNVIETMFESTLGFQDVPDLDALNGLAEKCCAWLNNVHLHSRLKTTRSAVWSMIPAERLREIPADWDVFRCLFDVPEPREVSPGGLIQFGGLVYRTRDADLCGETVTVHYNPYDHPAIVVSHVASGKRIILHAQPVDRYGRLITGANQAAGTFDRLPDSQSVRSVRQVLAREHTFDGRALVEAMGRAAAETDFLGGRKQGEAIRAVTVNDLPTLFDERLDAKDYLENKYGPQTPETLRAVHDLLPETGISVAVAEEAYQQVIDSHRREEEQKHA